MLIVITRDQSVIDWAKSPSSKSYLWGETKILSAGTQQQANAQMSTLLKLVKTGEQLCITGHGNDTEVGDEGANTGDWTWTSDQLAGLLAGLVMDYQGPILMEVCADSITDFSAHLVQSLENLKALNRVWVYGYNKSVDVTHPFPDPTKLDSNVELTGKQVRY